MRLEIDMIAGSEIRDTQGEVLSIEGADISDLEAGRGRFNDNHGSGFFNTIGRITFAKKILKEEDATDDRQRYYWNKIKVPFIYVRGYLFDDEDHPNARAAAAILRNIHKTDSPLQLKASVEGSVIARGISDPKLLARTRIHSVALTFTPANQNTLVEPLSVDKSKYDDKADMAIINSVLHLATTDVPSFRQITRMASAEKIESNLLKIVNTLSKYGVDTSNIKIPSKQQLIKNAINKKINNNLKKIHRELELIKQELSSADLSSRDEAFFKNIKAKILGTMVGLAPMTLSTPKTEAPKDIKQQEKVTHQRIVDSIRDSHPELYAIAHVESSGGKNLSHRTIKSPNSMHFGHKAGGAFGMMPHMVALTISKHPDLKNKYPKLAEAASDVKANHQKITEMLNSDPEMDREIATAAFNYIKNKTIHPDQAFYAWYNGLSGSWKKLKDNGKDAISNHWYVNRVKSKLPSDVKKALYAGYGYAGSPSSLVGGGVIQSESIEGSKLPGFLNFTCNNCGKDQVYFKYQVKCRHCASPISFDQLKKLTDSYKKNK